MRPWGARQSSTLQPSGRLLALRDAPRIATLCVKNPASASLFIQLDAQVLVTCRQVPAPALDLMVQLGERLPAVTYLVQRRHQRRDQECTKKNQRHLGAEVVHPALPSEAFRRFTIKVRCLPRCHIRLLEILLKQICRFSGRFCSGAVNFFYYLSLQISKSRPHSFMETGEGLDGLKGVQSVLPHGFQQLAGRVKEQTCFVVSQLILHLPTGPRPRLTSGPSRSRSCWRSNFCCKACRYSNQRSCCIVSSLMSCSWT